VSTATQATDAVKATTDVLKDLYKQIQADQMNKVLYILTVVTTVFIPAQFLTGMCVCVCSSACSIGCAPAWLLLIAMCRAVRDELF